MIENDHRMAQNKKYAIIVAGLDKDCTYEDKLGNKNNLFQSKKIINIIYY